MDDIADLSPAAVYSLLVAAASPNKRSETKLDVDSAKPRYALHQQSPHGVIGCEGGVGASRPPLPSVVDETHCIAAAAASVPTTTEQESVLTADIPLCPSDVPSILKDFATFVLKLEQLCSRRALESAPDTADTNSSTCSSSRSRWKKELCEIQTVSRICASISVRLHRFFVMHEFDGFTSPSASPTDSVALDRAEDLSRLSRDAAPRTSVWSKEQPSANLYLLQIAKLRDDYEKIRPKFSRLCEFYGLIGDSSAAFSPDCQMLRSPSGDRPDLAAADGINRPVGAAADHMGPLPLRICAVPPAHEMIGTDVGDVNAASVVVRDLDDQTRSSIVGNGRNGCCSTVTSAASNRNDRCQPTAAPSTGSSSSGLSMKPPPAAANHLLGLRKLEIRSIDEAIRREQADRLWQIQQDVHEIKTLTEDMAGYVDNQQGAIDAAGDSMMKTEYQSWQATLQLAEAAKVQSRWWTFGGAASGLVAGGISGLALGPIGGLVGAAVGGTVGLFGSRKLKRQHRRHLDQLCQRGTTT